MIDYVRIYRCSNVFMSSLLLEVSFSCCNLMLYKSICTNKINHIAVASSTSNSDQMLYFLEMMSDDDDYYFFEDDYNTDSERDWYDDDDDIDFDDYAMCGMGDSDHMDYEPYRSTGSTEQSDQQTICKELNIPDPDGAPKNPLALLDICASKVALTFPFAYVEDRDPPIPENVQLKIISSSFPQDMEKIKRYCSLNNGTSTEFNKAIKIVKSVKDLTQIGKYNCT